MGDGPRVMDIFEAQRRAAIRSALLGALWALLTAALVVPAYAVVWLLAHGWPLETPLPGIDAPALDPLLAVATTGAVVVAVTAGSLYQWIRLRRGGAEVARLIGGRPVADEPTDPLERRLRDVADEVAIAATVSTPRLFVLGAEPGINGFSAGFRPESSAIAVTAGALERLDRDELQALVAHELAHIVQGDARLRTASLALLHGFLFTSLAGAALMGGTIRGRTVKLRLAFFLGVGLRVAGSLGTAVGGVFQAATGRQREFLADARAAQLTRAPRALAAALQKTAGDLDAADVRHRYSLEVRHLFFSQGIAPRRAAAPATHPPLDARIRRLDPTWDGYYVHTRLPEGSATAAIAGALRAGGTTTIPDTSEWSHPSSAPPRPPPWSLRAFAAALARQPPAGPSPWEPPVDLGVTAPAVRLPRLPDRSDHGPAVAVGPAAAQLHSFLPVRDHVRTALAAAAAAAGGGDDEVRAALRRALRAMAGSADHGPGPDSDPALPTTTDADAVDADAVEAALRGMGPMAPGLRQRFLIACAHAVDRGGTTTPEAAALVHTFGRRLGVDLPACFRG